MVFLLARGDETTRIPDRLYTQETSVISDKNFRIKRYLSTGCITALWLLAACGSDDGGSAIDRAVDFIGGESALNGLQGFSFETSGTRFVAGEGVNFDDPAQKVSSFTATVSHDLVADAMRIDYQRTIDFLGGAPFTYSEIYNGNLGFVAGLDSALNPDSMNLAMLSSRWASGRKQHELLNPHLLLREVLAGRATATDAGEMVAEDVTFQRVDISDAVSPIQLVIAEDGTLTRATTLVNDFLHRDTTLEVIYDDWQGDGVKFPNKVSIKLGEHTIHVEDRSRLDITPSFAADAFDIPAEANAMFDQTLADWGEATHQFFQVFTALGIPIDIRQNTATSLEVETGSGVWHIIGGSHHSLAIEQDAGIVVVEGPHSAERADAVIAEIEKQIPGKPITHVIATHHHEDHTAGLRSFVAKGATVVVHAAAEQFYGPIFSAPSTIVPDSLAMNPMTPDIMTVAADGELILQDSTNTVEIYPLANPHAADMLLVYVPQIGINGGGYVFESDLYNPSADPDNDGFSLAPAFARALLDGIDGGVTGGAALDVSFVVGGHGDFAPRQDLVDYVAANPVTQ